MAFDKNQYDQEYTKQNIVTKRVVFNRTKQEDMELLAWAESGGNFNRYIHDLIRRDKDGKQEDRQ